MASRAGVPPPVEEPHLLPDREVDSSSYSRGEVGGPVDRGGGRNTEIHCRHSLVISAGVPPWQLVPHELPRGGPIRPESGRPVRAIAAGKGIPLMDSREAVPRDQVGRAVGIVGLVGIAMIHFLDAFSVIDESKFVFGLYIMLMVVTLLAGGILLRTDSRRAWMLGGPSPK